MRAEGLSIWSIIGGIVVVWLLLLARSAWKQGEFGQFARALGIILVLLVVVSGVVSLWIWVDRT